VKVEVGFLNRESGQVAIDQPACINMQRYVYNLRKYKCQRHSTTYANIIYIYVLIIRGIQATI